MLIPVASLYLHAVFAGILPVSFPLLAFRIETARHHHIPGGATFLLHLLGAYCDTVLLR